MFLVYAWNYYFIFFSNLDLEDRNTSVYVGSKMSHIFWCVISIFDD